MSTWIPNFPKITVGRFFFLTALLLLFFFGDSFTLDKTLNRLKSWDYFFAPLLILYLVSVLEGILAKCGIIKGMERFLSVKGFTRLSYAFIPGFIGLIPSIGGAHFACSVFPVSTSNLSGCRIAAINYFFRHFHVYSNPLIAGTVLACSITNVSLWSVSLTLFPLSVITFFFGWKFLLPPALQNEKRDSLKIDRIPLKFMLISMLIALETLVFFIQDCKLYIWLITVIITLTITSPRRFFACFLPRINTLILLSEIAFVLFFALVISSLNIAEILTNLIHSTGISIVFAYSLITILLAYLTGISQAYIAITMPLIHAMPGRHELLVCWLLALGFYIQFFTPSHLCLVVCANYYNCPVLCVLKKIFLPTTISFFLWAVIFGLFFFF